MPVSSDDYAGVVDHIGRYCWRVDAGDGDGWAALWTEEGEFSGISPEPIVGREALRQVAIGIKANFGDSMAHAAASIYCDYAENTDTVYAHLYNLVTTWEPDASPRLRTLARCRMTLVRNGSSGWLIRKNEANLLADPS